MRKGFTLLELIIALGLFSVIVLIAVGGFARALRVQRQLSAFGSVNANMRLVLEQMAREIRTGANFCTNGTFCASSDVLSFINAHGENVTYCFSGNAIKRVIGANPCDAGQKITANNISISHLIFLLSGNLSSDKYPPRITILMGAAPIDASASNYKLYLQTTVSSRALDG